jgi:hypothetical protein
MRPLAFDRRIEVSETPAGDRFDALEMPFLFSMFSGSRPKNPSPPKGGRGHARVVVSCAEPDALAEKIVAQNLSAGEVAVRCKTLDQLEFLCRRLRGD